MPCSVAVPDRFVVEEMCQDVIMKMHSYANVHPAQMGHVKPPMSPHCCGSTFTETCRKFTDNFPDIVRSASTQQNGLDGVPAPMTTLCRKMKSTKYDYPRLTVSSTALKNNPVICDLADNDTSCKQSKNSCPKMDIASKASYLSHLYPDQYLGYQVPRSYFNSNPFVCSKGGCRCCQYSGSNAGIHVETQLTENNSSKHSSPVNELYPEIICPYSRVAGYDKSLEETFLCNSRRLLKLGGFYFPDMSMADARHKLRRASPGSFLVRNSSDPRFKYSISVKTARGVTSIRIIFQNGRFKLDCEDKVTLKLPSFDCIMKLLTYFIKMGGSDKYNCVFLESTGRKDTPVVLSKPYRDGPLPLKNICRTTINRCYSEEKKHRLSAFVLSPELDSFIREYPYAI